MNNNMYCGNCGIKLNNNDKFCSMCGKKTDLNKVTSKESNIKNNRTINIICKILLVINFIIIYTKFSLAENNIILYCIMLIITTIGILKTQQKKSKIFLILGIISLYLAISFLFGFMFMFLLTGIFLKFIGGVDKVNILDTIMGLPKFLLYDRGMGLSFCGLLIIGIIFIVIYKIQKVKNE